MAASQLSISDWVIGTSALIMCFELIYLGRRRAEFQKCAMLLVFTGILGALAVFFLVSAGLHLSGNPWIQPLRTTLMSIFSVVAALWLFSTIIRIRDLPQVEELERQIAKRTEILQAIIDSSPITIMQLNTDGTVAQWNPAAESLFGWTAKEVIGKPLPIIPEDRRHEFERAFRNIFEGTPNPPYLTQRLNKSGELVDVCIFTNRLETDKGVRAMAMITDVTQQRILSSQLENAKLEAERANAAKTRFLAQMSHEIRTPLTAILGFADLLSSHSLTEVQRDVYAGAIVRNGQSLTALIDDLLDLSKVEAGEMTVNRQPLFVRELLEDVRSCLQLKAKAKGIQLDLEVSDRVPIEVDGDQLRIRQILNNLVGNAIKFTTKGGVVLSADYRDGEIFIWVRDTGAGIAADQFSRLFKPFQQAHCGVAQKFGGTGLGLALSRELARLMGGEITLEGSIEGMGSEFLIRIPAKSLECLANQAHVDNVKEMEISPNLLTGRRILVADDAEDNLVLISHYLREVGAEVDCAHDGKEAIRKALSRDFDAVLMDIQMPTCDGITALKELRSRQYKPDVIALTAYALPEEREHCLAMGFSAYLTKPIQPKTLVQTVASRVVH